MLYESKGLLGIILLSLLVCLCLIIISYVYSFFNYKNINADIKQEIKTPNLPIKSKGQKGGLARSAKLSPMRRSEIARLGGYARWKKKKKKD